MMELIDKAAPGAVSESPGRNASVTLLGSSDTGVELVFRESVVRSYGG